MIIKKFTTPMLLILLMLFSLPALANSGRVTSMSGDVKVNGKVMSKLHKVKGGDKITTGKNGNVSIVMADKSVLDLRPNTKFKLERFKFNREEPKKSRSIMNLFSGSFRYISGLVGRTNHDNATIKMGTATAGIRGSVATFAFGGQPEAGAGGGAVGGGQFGGAGGGAGGTATTDATGGVSAGAGLIGGSGGTMTITVSLGKAVMTFPDGSTMNINRGQTGSAGTGGQLVRTTPAAGKDAQFAAAEAILADPKKAEDALAKMTDAEKAAVLAIMVANAKDMGKDGAAKLAAAVTGIVKANPKLAKALVTITSVLATDPATAKVLQDAVVAGAPGQKSAIETAAANAAAKFGTAKPGDTTTIQTKAAPAATPVNYNQSGSPVAP